MKKRQSPRKQDKANNNNHADDKGSPALPDGSAVIFVGPDIVEPLPEPLKYNMVGQFGGPCFDEKKREWNTSFPVEVDGSIEVDDGWEFNQVQHLGKNPRQIRAALDYVGLFSTQVCARIFITVLCNTTGTNGQPDLKEVHGAKLSGFWLDNTKFMTCAHFLETIRDTNSDETEKLLKAQNLTEPRAFVCARKRVGALDSRKALSDPQTWPVHLLGLSRSSDIAIFELAKGSEPSPHSVPLDMLSPSFAMPTDGDTAGMSFDETDLAHSNLFAAYYPGHNISVEDSDVSISRKQLARQANIPDTWGLWCAESQHSLSDTDPHPADFVTTFTPNCRSVAFGSVETGYRGHPKLHKNGSSCFVQTRDCSIVGVYGCSGGIVCHLYREKNRWKTAVVGVFHGESQNDPRYNEFLAFTPKFVEALRTGSFWSTE